MPEQETVELIVALPKSMTDVLSDQSKAGLITQIQDFALEELVRRTRKVN